MADNGMWFKLWIGADDDPDLGNLSLEDFARWCKFGLYIKKYGTDGTVELKKPCLPLQHKFKVTSFEAVIKCISMFPNCTVTYETNAFVTFKNWYKYQGDISTGRVRQFRQRETAKKRREEMRGDETRREENIKSPAENAGAVDNSKPETGNPFEPLIRLAAEIGAKDKIETRSETSQKLVQWTVSMLRTLQGEPEDRVLAVTKSSLEIVRGKIESGYEIKSVWGLLTAIFNKERTKYMQGPENQAHKNAPMESFGEILQKIAATVKT